MNRPDISTIMTPLLLSFLMAALCCCSHTEPEWSLMDRAESLMQAHPDSALAVLEEMDAGRLNGREDAARYALLRSMALDKNCVDTTTFSILQPAIDYYTRRNPEDPLLSGPHIPEHGETLSLKTGRVPIASLQFLAVWLKTIPIFFPVIRFRTCHI